VDKLGKLLPRVLAKQPNNRQIAELRIRLAFLELMGPQLAASCQEVSLRGGTLAVSTDNPALAHQLRLDAADVVGRLNAMVLPRPVRTLRVRSGRGHGAGGI
jgi:predicted nucleic acid-binding Zn ribbon protein